MLLSLITIASLVGSSFQYPINQPKIDPLDYVDLFYGTENGGHMFPGSTRPFGMAKLGVDGIDPSFGDAYSGYTPGGVITGISMMHESGTGGAPEYGLVSQLPIIGDFDPSVEHNLTRSSHDVAKVGYYNFNTTSGIVAEFAAAERSGILKYTFPSGTSPQLLVNGSHHLSAPKRPWWTQYFVNGSITADADLSGYSGHTTLKGGWGDLDAWTLYFAAKFDTSASSVKSYEASKVSENSLQASSTTQDGSFGLVFLWDQNHIVQSKVGISFISADQALKNIDNDLGSDFDLEKTVQDTQKIWQDEVFSKIDISSENATIASYLYTSLYGAHLLPSNRTGENPHWDAPVYYDDWFTIWDTFRCLNPLFNIINPSRGSELVKSLIEIYKHDGYTPDGRSANQNGRTQGGSNSDILMADAYVKGIQGIDWDDAFEAMVKNAEVAPPYWHDSFAPDADTKEGRGALPDWLKYGYVTNNYTRSLTRTIEYSYDDFALSVVAKGLNNQTAYEKYLQRSSNWQKIWNFNATAKGKSYKGFIQPKNADGTFNSTNYDPFDCGKCYWGDLTYEGKAVEYGWAVPWDIETLILFIGGKELFVTRLDDMYKLHGTQEVADVGNEPSFLTPYLYNFVNEQYRSVETVSWIIDTYFTTGSKGLPGNSDAGAMQAWLIFGLLGFYPIAGTPNYLITSPKAKYFSINLDNGNKLEITANGLSEQNKYVQSVTINGAAHNQNWVDHSTLFSKGGSIVFEMTNDPVVWESGTAPPSVGHVDKNN
ncbi:glycoside hydrolase family 92 protein [Suhomyces tanzawaensis NRRL Y-17324]|uniref:Glycoside hydrolase family 92 protein n=1 Tax=Suhomyces tanzawaensis NRRL Y-17324 TaxID=984487 RepID=A0A1E4SRA9_9ASCO|nr:glycoside hydrolase family 92 protein [Suhomyces tanzawaensis NRRL Y-17324]ODV82035.1 glycoside hydrolase family 92 protein [Suhomyces tanzawaensis NRRL Y-17324]